MYIDTIVLKYYTQIIPELLKDRWDCIDKRKSDGTRYTVYYLNEQLENGALVKCTYYPYAFTQPAVLQVEFSIPMVLYGNNYTVVEDFREAIGSIDEILANIDGLPPVMVETGIVHRVDVYADHQVGDLVPYYIKALQPLEYRYLKTAPWTSQGVQYFNKQRCTKFYDKEKQSRNPINHGILRQETTLRSKAVKKLTGKKQPNIFDLAPELLRRVLEDALKDLDLFDRSIGTGDTTLQVLTQEYGELAGLYYYGLLHAKVNLTPEIIQSATKSHPRSIDRRLQKILDAGVPLTLTEHTRPLPPLVIR